MLLSDAGRQLGLLSGGCIESDLLLQARKVIALGKSRKVIYDASDDSNIAWRLGIGIGCGGAAEILLTLATNKINFFISPLFFRACKNNKRAIFICRLKPRTQVSPPANAYLNNANTAVSSK